MNEPQKRKLKPLKWFLEAIAKGDTTAINYFIAQKYTEALKEIGSSDNSKVVLMPLEAGNLIGSVAGIAEILKSNKTSS